MKKKFKFPEKWCIYLDDENIQELTKFYLAHINEYPGCSNYTIHKGDSFHYPQHGINSHSWRGKFVEAGYTSINFQEFKKYVLNESMDIETNEDLGYLIELFKKLNIK